MYSTSEVARTDELDDRRGARRLIRYHPAVPIDPDAVRQTLANARAALLKQRHPQGHWEGELSSSALSTATAVFALHLFIQAPDRSLDTQTQQTCRRLIKGGLAWLVAHENEDGGWGDTVLSISNISTTVLCWAALAAGESQRCPDCDRAASGAEAWLARHAGGVDPDRLVPAIIARYGKDKTFSVPILTMAALAGKLGAGREAWLHVPQLPFELAAFPQRWFKWLRLPVVSYALPALIAIGLVRHRRRPTWNLPARQIRTTATARSLRLLSKIQPASGGFLEATPLTSFVAMSLIGAGEAGHPVVSRGVEFLVRSARRDGSWAIDTNLATWVTTLAINALAINPGFHRRLSDEGCEQVRDWLLGQQYQCEHPYTLAPAGAWAWTNLPGGVPDADDTPGALLALRNLVVSRTSRDEPSKRGRVAPVGPTARLAAQSTCDGPPGMPDDPTKRAAAMGVRWLLDLQNRDGGIPTFCRGWGTLPFDRSSPDLTAHALRAWSAWREDLPKSLGARVDRATRAAIDFLRRSQQPDGSWLPLWFGNQRAPDDVNPTYGTCRVLIALAPLVACATKADADLIERVTRAVKWLVKTQLRDGGWGGGPGTEPSIEETALAVEALAVAMCHPIQVEGVAPAVDRGVEWLLHRTNRGQEFSPTPIGFYFAKLWYFEMLYPVIFTVAALEAVARILSEVPSPSPGTPGEGSV